MMRKAGQRPSSGKIILPNLEKAQGWTCRSCGIRLSADSVVKGAAAIKDGVLTCAACQKKKDRPRTAPRIPALKIMAVTLLLAGVAAPFFPAEVLFAAALAGLPTTAFFLFGESLFGPRRIIAVCLSLLASAGCLTGAIVLGEQRTAAREHSEFLSELERIEASLNEDRFPEARDRILTFRSRIQRQPGVYVSDAGQHASEKADKLLDAWLHDRFGELSPEGRYLVGVLLTRYSFKTASGARRFPSLSVSKKSIKLTALVEMPAGDRRQAFLQGHAILNLATDTLPDVPKLELQLVGVGPDGQEENLGTLNLPSE